MPAGPPNTVRLLVHQAQEGNKLAQGSCPFLATPQTLDRYIAARQIGITLSSLLLGAHGQSQIAALLELEPVFGEFGGMQQAAAESTAVAVALVVLTVAQMTLGELVPKWIALQFPNQTPLMTAVPMGWSLRVLRPFIWLLNGSGLALLKLLGSSHSHRHIHSPKEIERMISESTRGGIIDPEKRHRLNRALALGLGRGRDVMVPLDRMTCMTSATVSTRRSCIRSATTRFVRTTPATTGASRGPVQTGKRVYGLSAPSRRSSSTEASRSRVVLDRCLGAGERPRTRRPRTDR